MKGGNDWKMLQCSAATMAGIKRQLTTNGGYCDNDCISATSNRTTTRAGKFLGGGRLTLGVLASACSTDLSHFVWPDFFRQTGSVISPELSTLTSISAILSWSSLPLGRSQLKRRVDSTSPL